MWVTNINISLHHYRHSRLSQSPTLTRPNNNHFHNYHQQSIGPVNVIGSVTSSSPASQQLPISFNGQLSPSAVNLSPSNCSSPSFLPSATIGSSSPAQSSPITAHRPASLAQLPPVQPLITIKASGHNSQATVSKAAGWSASAANNNHLSVITPRTPFRSHHHCLPQQFHSSVRASLSHTATTVTTVTSFN